MVGESFHQRGLDTRALEIAVRAETLIQTHIDECAENRRQVMLRFDEGKKDRELQRTEMNRIVNRGLTYFIGLLVISLGYFLVRFGLPGA